VYHHYNEPSRRTAILGIGTYLPERVLTSPEIEAGIADAGIAMSPGFIERATGVGARRIAAEGENASDLAVAAASEALESAGLGPLDVDLLIFAAASHDVTEPATANIVQAKLAAHHAQAFDLKNACNSLVTALDVADSYVQSGRARVVLIAAGEMPSRATDLRFRSREDVLARFAHLTFGDAGGAVVLGPSPTADRGIVATAGVTRGEAWNLATVLSFGTMYPRDTYPQGGYLRSRSCELEAYGRAEVPRVARAALAATGWRADQVDVVATHQHSKKLLYEIADEVGLRRETLMLPLRQCGNTASANVALALAEARERGRLRPEAKVLLCSAGSGFSVAATTVAW
jgi:3-oxoacyl-[acyl-carrier-protein] synthase-3